MVLNPAITAMSVCSAFVCLAAVLAALAGLGIAWGWNPDDSGSRQLMRERRLCLVEAGLRFVLAFQVVSVFLFVAIAQQIHTLFTGAMCAAGMLNAGRFGYPTLWVKLAVLVLAGVWLVVNRFTTGATTHRLVRFKCAWLVLIAGALLLENGLQLRYYAALDPEIITSCCASIFSPESPGIGGAIAGMPVRASQLMFLAGLAAVFCAGIPAARGGTPAVFSLLIIPIAVICAAAVVVWIAPAFYELPGHHCPFCLMSADYGFVGYPLYAALLVSVVAGSSSGLIRWMRNLDPAGSILPLVERRLCLVSMSGLLVFCLIAAWPLMTPGSKFIWC